MSGDDASKTLPDDPFESTAAGGTSGGGGAPTAADFASLTHLVQRMMLRFDELDSRLHYPDSKPTQDSSKPNPSALDDGAEGGSDEDDPPPGFPARPTRPAPYIDPRDWIDQLPTAYADCMPPANLSQPSLWTPRLDEWDRYLTEERRTATHDEYRHLLCYGVFGAAAHAALETAMATLHGGNASAADTEDAWGLLASATRTLKAIQGASEDRLTYLRRFKCKKALTGDERVAERLVYSRFLDTAAAERSANGVDGLLSALEDKKLEVSLLQAAKAQAAQQFKNPSGGGGGSGDKTKNADTKDKNRADKDKKKADNKDTSKPLADRRSKKPAPAPEDE